jgi:hypothetical protein
MTTALDCSGPLRTWRYTVCVVGKGEGYAPPPTRALGAGAGSLTRGPLAGWATLAAKFRRFETRQDLHTMHIRTDKPRRFGRMLDP